MRIAIIISAAALFTAGCASPAKQESVVHAVGAGVTETFGVAATAQPVAQTQGSGATASAAPAQAKVKSR